MSQNVSVSKDNWDLVFNSQVNCLIQVQELQDLYQCHNDDNLPFYWSSERSSLQNADLKLIRLTTRNWFSAFAARFHTCVATCNLRYINITINSYNVDTKLYRVKAHLKTLIQKHKMPLLKPHQNVPWLNHSRDYNGTKTKEKTTWFEDK